MYQTSNHPVLTLGIAMFGTKQTNHPYILEMSRILFENNNQEDFVSG